MVPELPNAVWSVDFMSDTLYEGRRFRTLNILDESVREALAIEIDTSLPAKRVIRALTAVEVWRGLPKAIRLDNGPEFIAENLRYGARRTWSTFGSSSRASRIRTPSSSASIGAIARKCSTPTCWDLDQVREISHEWLYSYNEERPHDALGSLPPACSASKSWRQEFYF